MRWNWRKSKSEFFTARVHSTTGRYCFHRCLSVHMGRTPSPSHNTSTGPMSCSGGTPVTDPRSLPGGTPVPDMGTPPPPSQVRMGYSPALPPPPPPPYRTAKGVLPKRRVVCLLRSNCIVWMPVSEEITLIHSSEK